MTTAPAAAATLPAGFTEFTVATGLSNPTAMAFAPDGRIFVCLQGGAVRVVSAAGTLLPTPFISLTVDQAGERGLLGLAFDPSFASNQYVYLYYTVPTPLHNRVSRFTANGNVVVPGSEVILLDIDDSMASSGASNHNGGAMDFSADGKLLIAIGERANSANSQSSLTGGVNLLGKLLRMNSDGSIPTDNPFYSSATGLNRLIYSRGLRNPYSFDVQPGTGRVFLNDVGGGGWEEVNEIAAGANYGWPTTEGNFNTTTYPQFRLPFYTYNRPSPDCAIVGAGFYNPPTVNFPTQYVGSYFFADYCGGWIRVLDPNNPAAGAAGFATGIASPIDVETGPEGNLYYLSRGSSALRRIAYGSGAPSITTHPQSQTIPRNDPVTFTVAASGAALTYQWQRNNTGTWNNIGGATGTSYTIGAVATADNGAQFRCVVTNGGGSTNSNTATLTVTGNSRPTAAINTPVQGTIYNAGDTIGFSGTGTDAEDGGLGASRFTWQVDFHHDSHTHPFMAATTNMTSGSITIPIGGETSSNVWYRIYLTVTDSGGLSHTVTRDVNPRVARVTLASQPPLLALQLDGAGAPPYFDGVAGMLRTLAAVSPQTWNGATWAFSSWSDGGARSHSITTPTTAATFTASFTCTAPTNPAPIVQQLRLYNTFTHEHLYTNDVRENNALAGRNGWIAEGNAYQLFSGTGQYNGTCAVPMYRLYHSPSAQHFWTTDARERDALAAAPGWAAEGTSGWVLPNPVAGAVPLYRLVYPNPLIHLWTTNMTEVNALVGQGWTNEGFIGYVR